MSRQYTPRLMADILPPNGTLYERTLASSVDRLLELDADAIRTLWNPQTCPIELLPYLAWALSVDIWDPDWPESKKRAICAASFTDHAQKGTTALIERYLGYVDATLVRAVVPPAKTYCMGGFKGDESRMSWLAGLPQIRIYPFLQGRTPPKNRAFYRNSGQTVASFYGTSAGRSYAQDSAGPILAGKHAFYVTPDGQSTPASYELQRDDDSGTLPQRVAVTTKQGAFFYGNSSYGRAWMQESAAEDNVVVVRLQQQTGQRYTVSPGSVVTDVQPLRVNQIRQAPRMRGFLGAIGRQRFMLKSYAGNLVYDQISILDPANPLVDLRRKTRFHYGNCRFGIAPFTAELAVEIPLTRPRSRRGTFYTGFMKKADLTPLKDALGAIRVGRALRDTVLVDTEIYRPVQLSDELFLGSFTLGQVLKVK